MDSKLISGAGNGGKPGTEALIDLVRGALRTSNSPIDHSDASGNLLGFYRAVGITGTTISVGAGGVLSYVRWTDTSRILVLMRIQAAVAVAAAITAATIADLGAYVSRGSNTAGSAGNLLAMTGNSGKARANMGASLVTDARIATTGALTAPTTTVVDANPFAASPFGLKVSPDIGATAATGVAVGVAAPLVDLYKWDVNGSHPVILTAGESIELKEITAGPVSGGLKWYLQYEWAELVGF